MKYLSKKELNTILGGAFYTPFDLIYKIYLNIKIRWLVKKLFID